jgi:hypothetical protein
MNKKEKDCPEDYLEYIMLLRTRTLPVCLHSMMSGITFFESVESRIRCYCNVCPREGHVILISVGNLPGVPLWRWSF